MSHNTDDKARSVRTGAAVACQGKVRFDTHALAMAVAARTRKGKHRGRSCYACGVCNGWHIGYSNGAEKVRRRALLAADAGRVE